MYCLSLEFDYLTATECVELFYFSKVLNFVPETNVNALAETNLACNSISKIQFEVKGMGKNFCPK